MNNKGAATSLVVFLIALVVVTIVAYVYSTSINDLNSNYGTSYSTSGLVGYNSSNTLTNLSSSLNNEFNGVNATSSEAGSLGASFNQVYTLGIVTTRIIGTITPAIFNNIIMTTGDALGIPPVITGLAFLVVSFLLISYLLYVLLGRQL